MKRSHKGFTLLELMVTVGIVAIVAAIAFANSGDMLARDRAESHLQELKRQLMFARAKATSADAIVIICPLSSGNCTNNWQSNTVSVFVDENGNDAFDNGDTMLREMEAIRTGDALAFSGGDKVTYDATGRIGNNESGDFTYCPSMGDNTERTLTLTQSGTALYRGRTNQGCS